MQDLEFLDLLGRNRRVHLLPSTCCAFCKCWLVLLVGLLVFPFLCHLCRLTQGASFLLWITSRPSSELILYYLQIGAFCSSVLYELSLISVVSIHWSEICIFPYTVSSCLFPLQKSWKISKVVCQSSLLSLACWDVGFLSNSLRLGITANFLSKEGIWLVCLTQQPFLQLQPRAWNSVVSHAWIGKKPKKMIVILNTVCGLLGL